MRRHILALFAGLLLFSAPAFADVIATRAELMALLGPNATIDDFESFTVGDAQYVNTGISYLDNSSVIKGNGPGLVHAGATYSFERAPCTWMGANYNSIATKTLVAWNAPPPPGAYSARRPPTDSPSDVQLFFAVLITFLNPVNAFGVDLWRFDVVGLLTIELYDDNSNFPTSYDVAVPSLGAPSFFGLYSATPISALVVKNTRLPNAWSPNLDNVTYGVATNTPTSKTSWGRIKSLYR